MAPPRGSCGLASTGATAIGVGSASAHLVHALPVLLFAASTAVVVSATPFTATVGEAVLVVDHDGSGAVTSTQGLKRMQHSPQKMGQVLKQDYPWETGLYFYGSTVQTSQGVRLYYGCSGPDEPTKNFVCVATSEDGVMFQKPLDVGQVLYNGSTANNIVMSLPYGPGGHAGTGWGNAVTYDDRPGVPAGEVFKMLYDTDNGIYSGRKLLIAVSPDGFR